MKSIILILMFCVPILIGAQGLNDDESVNAYIVHSPGSWKDGYSVGAGFDYQNKFVYVGPEIYYFPDLHDLDYLHAIGRIGFNLENGGCNVTKFRFFIGTRLGVIYREGGGLNYANIGGEIGGQITLSNKLFGRIAGSVDEATDSKLWSGEDHFTRRSVWVSIGYRF